jgi:hypothetical protein
MERTPEWMSDRIAKQDAEIAALRDKALAYDLDQAGIERRAAEAVELVEARAEIAALRAEVKELRKALILLLHEVDESGNGYSTDFGWPKATQAARQALRGEGNDG